MSNVWNMIQEKKEITKHMPKKHKHILVPSQRYQDSRHILQNPRVSNYVIGFSNRPQRFTGSNYLDVDSPFIENRAAAYLLIIQPGIPHFGQDEHIMQTKLFENCQSKSMNCYYRFK